MKSEISIRPVTTFEERASMVLALGGYAFEPSPPLPERDKWESWLRNQEEALALAFFEGDRPLAMVWSSPFTQYLRGEVYPMAGIWGVASHPAARRNGYIRTLMADLLRQEREAGKPLTCLYPFRPSFYERMGYVTFPQPRVAKINPRVLAPLLTQDFGGTVDLLLMADGHDIYRAYLQQHQRRVEGMALRSEIAARGEREQKAWLAVARVDGEPVGVMIYKNEGKQDNMVMNVWRFYAHTIQGRYLLLDWFARHVDQIERVEVRLPPAELPETWLGDMGTLQTERVWPPMGRVLDVAGISGMRVGSGRFAARVDDPLCPWNARTWNLAGIDGRLTVTPEADTAADCTLTIQGLSALIYGNHDPAAFAIQEWGDPSPDVQAAMRAVFPPMLPYLHEEF